MSTSISVSPFGRIPSLGLACALGAEFCAVADGDEQAAAPSAAASAASSKGLFMIRGILPQRQRDPDVNVLLFSICISVSPCLCGPSFCVLRALYQSNFVPNRARRGGT